MTDVSLVIFLPILKYNATTCSSLFCPQLKVNVIGQFIHDPGFSRVSGNETRQLSFLQEYCLFYLVEAEYFYFSADLILAENILCEYDVFVSGS